MTVIAAGEHWPAGEQPAGQHHPPAGYRPAGQHQPTEGYPPSGEHQPTEGYLPAGQLRPALEDLLGAAAIIAALGRHVPRSAEATATEAVWHEHGGHVAGLLSDCVSGRELTGRGFPTDVSLAAEHDAQDAVPVLTDGAFRAAVIVPP